jgi:hypothetical protein
MRAVGQARALAIGIALAAPLAAAGQTPPVGTPPPASHELHAPAQELLARSEALESSGDLLGAAALFETALGAMPRDAHLYWRIARDLLRHAEASPALGDDERAALYTRARDWARDGRALDAECAECCLYEFASTARLASVRGLTRAVGTVREAGRLLEECLVDPPRWVDAGGSEAAALYYGGSVYYRLLPDSSLFAWATGQRSDAARAVELARLAVAEEAGRPRYQLELAAALLCDGARRDDAEALREGRRWLEAAAAGEGADAENARALRAAEPAAACSLSHD